VLLPAVTADIRSCDRYNRRYRVKVDFEVDFLVALRTEMPLPPHYLKEEVIGEGTFG